MPSLQSLKVYKAHNASISSISISPYPPPLPSNRSEFSQRLANLQAEESDTASQGSPNSKRSPKQPTIPKIPSNDIYIATSSIDGNVCVASLIDPSDVQLRNFGRPVQAVALSPDFKSDRSYLSGGQAGSLILTTGGQKGKSVNATTTGTAAAASGWLGSIGLGGNTGTDKVLHSGEGTISTIKWSLTGKYVLWVNEQGIKIRRSNLNLNASEAALEWKAISHTDRPNKGDWDEMAGVWKARAEWIDRRHLESDENASLERGDTSNGGAKKMAPPEPDSGVEEVIVGWGDAVWLLRVVPGSKDETKKQGSPLGQVEIATLCRFPACTISGVSLYTSNLILVLAHMEKKKKVSKNNGDSARRGRPHRLNGLEPELRIVDVWTGEELDSDTLTVSRFEALSSSDYHLSVLPQTSTMAHLTQKGYLEALGSGVSAVGSGLYTGVETVGQGVFDATMYGPRRLGVNRLFSSGESMRNVRINTDDSATIRGTNYLTGWIPGLGSSTIQKDEVTAVAATSGMKIFLFSPYDCIVGVKRNLTDRMQWLVKMQKYQQAWELLDEHPEAAGPSSDTSGVSSPPTPSKASSLARSGSGIVQSPVASRPRNTLAEFFADSASIASSQSPSKDKFSKAEKEKRRIGELWLQQLLTAKEWSEAGEVAGKVLDTSDRWEHWIWTFIRNKKYDEISPYVPTFQITPPLKSSMFEIILGHYVVNDRKRFQELLDEWPSDLFEISSITSAIEDQLNSGTAPKGSDDWRILQECLAKLSLADGEYKEALMCYIRVQDADTALSLIKEHHLVDAVADDIPGFVLLRIPSSQLKSSSQEELAELASDPIKLLVDQAAHGLVEIDEIVTQLEAASLDLFLFFYLRALWRGEGSNQSKTSAPIRRTAASTLAADEGKLLVEQYADTAVELFAKHDRDLLMEFLHACTSYTYETAVKICEQRHYVEELVYLLSKTGAMKKALFLIIDELDDVSKAISFAKEQDDKGLWDDFLEYSMSRPKFISGLLAEVGTAIDPIALLRRIPSGLEIEGLKDGLQKMIREYDIQDSISSGVAKVLTSEVAVGMDTLRRGRRRGIKFDVPTFKKRRPQETEPNDAVNPTTTTTDENEDTTTEPEISPGHCAGCQQAFTPDESETLIGFACGHIYHVSHLFHEPGHENEHELTLPRLPNTSTTDDNAPEDEDESSEYSSGFARSVGPKVTSARLLKDRVEEVGGCKVCKARRDKMAEV